MDGPHLAGDRRITSRARRRSLDAFELLLVSDCQLLVVVVVKAAPRSVLTLVELDHVSRLRRSEVLIRILRRFWRLYDNGAVVCGLMAGVAGRRKLRIGLG